ncbi:hypothetical protein KR222_004809, partial [Zaprionus bogoriensis]
CSPSLWLLAFLALSGVFVAAQYPSLGKCPKVELLKTFDLNRYLGVWYEHSKYPAVFEIGKKCVYANYTLLGNGTVKVVNGGINKITGNPSKINGTAAAIAPGQLAVSFTEDPKEKANYLVLGTDYDTYAVVYNCQTITPLIHYSFVWILTREREPKPSTIETARAILEKNDISQEPLFDTNQKNC